MPTIRFCKAASGQRLAYAVDGQGPPLVFPAWWISHVEKDWQQPSFSGFFSEIAKRHTVIRYDRVGVGLSDRQRTVPEITVEREAADLACLIDELDLGSVTLFGASCGGPTAIAYAAKHPQRVSNLVLYGSYLNGCGIGNQETRDAMLALVRASWGLGSKTLASIFTPDMSPETVRRTTRLQRESADSETAARLLELTYTGDVAALAPRIQVPCLVMHRHGDTAIPFDLGRDLAANLPNASFCPFDGNAHTPWEGDSAPLLRALFTFLGSDTLNTVEGANGDASGNALVRHGDVWMLRFDEAQAHLKHTKGLADLATLLMRPGEEVSAVSLMQGTGTASAPPAELTVTNLGSDDVLDDKARKAYRERVRALQSDLAEAQEFNDLGRIERLEQERDAIISELQAATGLGGRRRKLKDPAERARKAVSARIRECIQRIDDALPPAGAHLTDAVRTGTFCCYEPKSEVIWHL